MRGEGQETRAGGGRRGRPGRRGEARDPTSRLRVARHARPSADAGPAGIRTVEEIKAQYDAARAFAGEVTAMMPTSHQYTAGQAAALAWLLELGPAPLTYDTPEATGNPSPEAVGRLAQRARELNAGASRGEVFPPAYVMGVDYVCHWVQGHTDHAPIPDPDRPLGS